VRQEDAKSVPEEVDTKGVIQPEVNRQLSQPAIIFFIKHKFHLLFPFFLFLSLDIYIQREK